MIRINGLYNIKEAGLQSIKSMASFTDLILHEYGGWEKFPNHTEETSVLERYTKASTLTLRGEKRERALGKEIVPWRIQMLDNLCKRQFLNYPLFKRSGFSKFRQPNCMILNQIKINFKYLSKQKIYVHHIIFLSISYDGMPSCYNVLKPISKDMMN